jgi:hypothetical protein
MIDKVDVNSADRTMINSNDYIYITDDLNNLLLVFDAKKLKKITQFKGNWRMRALT